ncbi:uncharacterized protein LOC124622470 [Schistocerca americana]|uniref:uncharacterized protein LOC124622470 n=1 Tax=Schistocerca americana TaxID=7009 RepID=UPI001F4F5583|nr:uncharacterized protein LOC124622470 [Schistocerca americana]XP_049939202.1 uncharacterized protein LOC126413334 [Schistocerca serialis cubense]
MDAVYPEPLSRLQHRRAVRKPVHRGPGACSLRYRTQPVTFAEIKEVDEENIDDTSTETTAGAASKSELDINTKFEEFWRAGREKAKQKKKAKEANKSKVISTDSSPSSPEDDTESETKNLTQTLSSQRPSI